MRLCTARMSSDENVASLFRQPPPWSLHWTTHSICRTRQSLIRTAPVSPYGICSISEMMPGQLRPRISLKVVSCASNPAVAVSPRSNGVLAPRCSHLNYGRHLRHFLEPLPLHQRSLLPRHIEASEVFRVAGRNSRSCIELDVHIDTRLHRVQPRCAPKEDKPAQNAA